MSSCKTRTWSHLCWTTQRISLITLLLMQPGEVFPAVMVLTCTDPDRKTQRGVRPRSQLRQGPGGRTLESTLTATVASLDGGRKLEDQRGRHYCHCYYLLPQACCDEFNIETCGPINKCNKCFLDICERRCLCSYCLFICIVCVCVFPGSAEFECGSISFQPPGGRLTKHKPWVLHVS